MSALVKTQAKRCEECDCWMHRRRSGSGRLEAAATFAKRRFCSTECYRKAASEGRRSRPVGMWV